MSSAEIITLLQIASLIMEIGLMICHSKLRTRLDDSDRKFHVFMDDLYVINNQSNSKNESSP